MRAISLRRSPDIWVPPPRQSSGIILFCLAILLGLASGQAFGSEADVEELQGEGYAHRVKALIGEARRDIDVAMYRMAGEDERVRPLLEALIEAKGRGVRVSVLLDQEARGPGLNLPAARLLQSAGIPVSWDAPETMLHLKTVVIDDAVVVVGSHNWTAAALEKNEELSVAIRSEPLARRVRELVRRVPAQAALEPRRMGQVDLEDRLMLERRWFARIVNKPDYGALDLYLWLKGRFAAGSSIDLDYERAADSIGLSETLTSHDAVKRLGRNVRTLEKRYGLLAVEKRSWSRASVRLLPIHGAQGSFSFPQEYFTWGWNRRMPGAAKACYLLACFEEQFETKNPAGFWDPTEEALSKKFGVSIGLLKKGMKELMNLNLIEVRYRRLRSGSPWVHARYRLKLLYDPAQNEKAFQELSQRYGEKLTEEARGWASAAYKQNDPTAVGLLLSEFKSEFKEPRRKEMEKAVRIVSRKLRSNPRRRFGYLVGTYRRLAAEHTSR